MDIKTLADIVTALGTIGGVLTGGYLAVRQIENHISKTSQKSIAESKTIKAQMENSFVKLQTFNGERYREINQGLYELKQKYEQDLVRLGEADRELESIITNLKTYVDKRFDELERIYGTQKGDIE